MRRGRQRAGRLRPRSPRRRSDAVDMLAERKDTGFDPPRFVEALASFRRFTPADLRVDPDERRRLIGVVEGWRRQVERTLERDIDRGGDGRSCSHSLARCGFAGRVAVRVMSTLGAHHVITERRVPRTRLVQVCGSLLASLLLGGPRRCRRGGALVWATVDGRVGGCERMSRPLLK